jgi:hypothetical protein
MYFHHEIESHNLHISNLGDPIRRHCILHSESIMNIDAGECCLVCTNPLDWTGIGPCGHNEICSRCVARMRFVLKDKNCAICKQECPSVFFTRYAGDYTSRLDFSVDLKVDLICCPPPLMLHGLRYSAPPPHTTMDHAHAHVNVPCVCSMSCSILGKLACTGPNEEGRAVLTSHH